MKWIEVLLSWCDLLETVSKRRVIKPVGCLLYGRGPITQPPWLGLSRYFRIFFRLFMRNKDLFIPTGGVVLTWNELEFFYHDVAWARKASRTFGVWPSRGSKTKMELVASFSKCPKRWAPPYSASFKVLFKKVQQLKKSMTSRSINL